MSFQAVFARNLAVKTETLRVTAFEMTSESPDNDRRGANWKKDLVLGDKKGTRADHLQSVMSDSRFDGWTRQYDFGMPKAIRDLAYGCVMTGVPISAQS